MRALGVLLVAALFVGCGKGTKPPVSPAESAATVLEMARARPVLDPVRARFNIRLQSPTLQIAGSTGAGLVIDRPRGRLDVFGPLGGSLVTFATDGERVDVVSMRDSSHLFADDAEDALRALTHGAAGMHDVLGLLLGVLPFDAAQPTGLRRVDDGGVQVALDGPRGVRLDVVLDAALGVPMQVAARDADGALMLAASYAGWSVVDDAGTLAPGELTLVLPLLDLTIDLKFRSWKALSPEEIDPRTFNPTVPSGYAVGRLEDALRAAGERVNGPDAHP